MQQYKLDYYKSLTLKQLVSEQTRAYDNYLKKGGLPTDKWYKYFSEIKSIVKPLREQLTIEQDNAFWNLTITEIEAKLKTQ